MQDDSSNDRRIFARMAVALPLRFLASGQEKESMAKTVDISANGIGFEAKEKLSPQTPLEMWLDLPNGRGPFYTRGEVVWSRPSTGKARFRTGIRLLRAELMGLAPILWG